MPQLGTPKLVGAGETIDFDASGIIGFVCTTAGDITISRVDGGVATVLVNALGATADSYIDLPIIIGSGKGRITSTTAVGTLILR